MYHRLHRGLISLTAVLVLGAGQALAASGAGTAVMPYTPSDWPLVVSQTSTSADITSGVVQETNRFTTVNGPLQANVVSIDLSNPNVKVGTVLANDKVYSSDETVSSMATRTGAVAGINADFFEIHASGRPEGLCVQDGTILQSPLTGGQAVVGITGDGQVTIGPAQFTGTATVLSATYGPPSTNRGSTTITPPNTPTNNNNSSSTGSGSSTSGTSSTGTGSTTNNGTSSNTGTTQGQTVTSSVYGTPLSSFQFVALNRPSWENNGAMGLITPAMGQLVYVKHDTVAYLNPVPGSNTMFQVQRVVADATYVPALTGQVALTAGGGKAAAWVTQYLKPGSTVTIDQQLSPHNDIVQAVGTGYQLLKDGNWYNDPHGISSQLVNGVNALTAVGVTKDNRHMFMVVFDGYRSNLSIGLNYHQMASYLQHLGAWNAAMLDGGGSTEMVARLPGDTQVSVLNSPSDGRERPVADGLFVYSTETTPGPVDQIVVNDGQPITMLTGTTQSLKSYALDAYGNPTDDSITYSVEPSTLARISGQKLIATAAGSGSLVATDSSGDEQRIPLSVVDHVASLTIQPSITSLTPGRKQTFKLTGVAANGQVVTVPGNMVKWTVSSSAIGQISTQGQLQTPTLAAGTLSAKFGKVTAAVGKVTASADVSTGYTASQLDPMTSLSRWDISSYATKKLSVNNKLHAIPGDSGALTVPYDFPADGSVYQYVFWPKSNVNVSATSYGDAPVGLGMWVYGDKSNLQLVLSLTDASGQRLTVTPAFINFAGWRYLTVPLPAGMGAPVSVNFLDLMPGHITKELKGNIYFSHLQALYAPVATNKSASSGASSAMPAWLNQVSSPAAFKGTGSTIALFGGTHISSTQPSSVGVTALNRIVRDVKSHAGTTVSRVTAIQSLGDMVSQATSKNFADLKKLYQPFGVAVHAAVGSGEISGSPENQAFHTAFGATHYTYTVGQAQFVVLDDAAGGINASDAHQSPFQPQLDWMTKTLTASRAKVVFVVANRSAYSASQGNDASMIVQKDATYLEQLVNEYQQANPDKHVMLLFAGGSALAVRQVNEGGQEDSQGLVNLYVPSATGGKTSGAYVLLHVNNQGAVQFALLPAPVASSAHPTATSKPAAKSHG